MNSSRSRPAAGTYIREDTDVKVAIIGASGHGIFVLEGLRRRPDISATLVGLAPGSEGESMVALAEACCADSLRPALYEDYRQMLDEQKPDVVAVNPFFCDHEKITLELLERRIHVFTEKPLAFTLEGLARLREAYTRSGVHLGCMLNMRYEPALRSAYNAIRSGAIGEVRLVHAQKSYKLGHRPAFFKQRATFGGLIPWVGSHAIDLIACMSGQRFVSVYAAHSTRNNRDHGELEVSASCLFRMSNEVIGTAGFDYLRPAAAPSHEDDRLRAVGAEGVIEVCDRETVLMNSAGMSELEPDDSTSLFGDFMDEVQGTGQSLVSTEEAFTNTKAALLARQSADSGKVVFF
jgi:predicted dehydrogenase